MRVFRILAVGAGLLASAACCPIPVSRAVSERPDLTVEVFDSSGLPAAGATVTVRRAIVGPPPKTETHRWTTTTDLHGRAHLPAIEVRETTLPLMMHGVPWYGWQVCASTPDGAATFLHEAGAPVEPPVALRLRLGPLAADCAWETWAGP